MRDRRASAATRVVPSASSPRHRAVRASVGPTAQSDGLFAETFFPAAAQTAQS